MERLALYLSILNLIHGLLLFALGFVMSGDVDGLDRLVGGEITVSCCTTADAFRCRQRHEQQPEIRSTRIERVFVVTFCPCTLCRHGTLCCLPEPSSLSSR